MAAIGLGKQRGAEIYHADGFEKMENKIKAVSKIVFEKSKVLFGVAAIENAYDETRRIEAIPVGNIFDEEPALLEEAKKHMASIFVNDVDVLVIDEIGKNISGDGMDPNITGRFATPYASGGVNAQHVVVLDLTDVSHGNANGIGLADFAAQRVFDKMDYEQTYPNAITSTVTGVGKIPLILPNDRLAVQAALRTCTSIDYNHPRIVRIKNTLHISEIVISEALMKEAVGDENVEILGSPEEMAFDSEGNFTI